MKSLVTFLIFFLVKTNAYVANSIQLDLTTETPNDFNENSEESTVHDKYEKDYSGYVYMDDVVFGLKSQNWTDEELPCLNETLHLIKSLHNFTTWAVWEWDSVSSQPLGILSGNRYQLGNFDQCMTYPWSTPHKEIKTQYCLAEVELETKTHVKKKTLDEIEPYGNALDLIQHNTPHFRPLRYLTWGACVPACCEPRSVEKLVKVVLARSHLGSAGLRLSIHVNETCQRPDEPKKFDVVLYAFIAVIGTIFVICLVCTIVNNKRNSEEDNENKICNAFCLLKNSKDLLKMNKGGIEVIYGIKYLTICGVVMCHQSSFIDVGPISNGIKVDEAQRVLGWLVLHDDLLVDTFFLISAFLTAKALFEFRTLPSIPLMIFRRYIRLVIGLAVVVFFMAAAFDHTGSGPLWNRFSDDEVAACRDNWWLNLLMLSNYIKSGHMCLVMTWYIPCDFHFFVITVIVFALYKRCPTLGMIIACVLAAASIITPGVINFINKLHAIQLFTYDFLSNPRGNRQFNIMYIKSHTRAAAYIVGLFAGYLFVKYKLKETVKFSQKKSLMYICAALTVMVFITFLGVSYQLRGYSELEGNLYAALNRPIWAAGVALIILTCAFGKVPLVSSFLRWYPWVPLSRLVYGVYLVHFIIIIRNIGISRNPEFYDHFSVLLTSLGVICISTFFALILWLFFEAPANNLIVLLFNRRSTQNTRENISEVSDATFCKRKGMNNSGYIEDNMSNTIQFSKM